MKFLPKVFIIVWLVLIGKPETMKAQSNGRLKAEVKSAGGVPSLFVNGKMYPPYAYMSYLGEEKYYKEVAEAGLHIFNIPAYLGDRGINSTSGIGPFRSAIWRGNQQYNLSSIIKDFEELLRADPEAKVILRLHLDPPVWWEEQNPKELSVAIDGETVRFSFASMKWRKEAGEALRYVVKELLESSYAQHLIGVHIAGGFTEEWFYHYKKKFSDSSDVRRMAFQKWIKQKYNDNINALRVAWNDPHLTFEKVKAVNISVKNTGKGWRNMGADQAYFDALDFHASLLTGHIKYFCEIVKDVSEGSLLTGAFYGYHFFVSDPTRGHGALAELLEFEKLDYLSSPNDYNRVSGEDWAPFAAIKSVQMHGKLWLAENDTRTSISALLKDRAPAINPPGGWYEGGVWLGPDDMKTSVNFLQKNLIRMLVNGYGGWWFDMWGGWFSDPKLLEVIKNAQELYNDYQEDSDLDLYRLMKPEVAVVVDERLLFWDNEGGKRTDEIIRNRYALGKTGIPYDLYLRTDLEKIDHSQYKVVWLMGLRELNEVEVAKQRTLLDEGSAVMYTDGDNTSFYRPYRVDNQFEQYEVVRWSAENLAQLWEEVGVHRYISTEDVLYAGRGWLSIHAATEGKKVVKLPFYADLIDPITKKIVASNVNHLEVEMKLGSVLLYRIKYLKTDN